jgi:hypothetical protein
MRTLAVIIAATGCVSLQKLAAAENAPQSGALAPAPRLTSGPPSSAPPAESPQAPGVSATNVGSGVPRLHRALDRCHGYAPGEREGRRR